MNGFLRDVLDVCLLRFKSLEQYSYAPWITALWLTLAGVTDAMSNDDIMGAWPLRLLFFVVVDWTQAVAAALWLGAWFKLIERKPVEFSFFPLVVLAGTPQMIAPLINGIGEPLGSYVRTSLALYGLFVLIYAISRSTGKRVGSAAIAALAFIPVAFVLMGGTTAIAESMGWVNLPPLTADAPDTSNPETDL
ncbi:hypothetical protein [Amantichitinum ursilacus]|uniref:Yip1 domain protein n=1 Tax=Amantichitinum ursilacus TaxID=857265 RepID=A0A0N0XMV5_9NEIS|nr:hypothetical protein [Amantichitinum ursilacus]KPC55123.1 hypothetical protein WG78_00650 [Amantichitinum ursilacus]